MGLKDGKDECGSSDDDDDEDGMQIVLLVLFLLELLKLSLATAALFQQSALKKGHSLFTLENTHTLGHRILTPKHIVAVEFYSSYP